MYKVTNKSSVILIILPQLALRKMLPPNFSSITGKLPQKSRNYKLMIFLSMILLENVLTVKDRNTEMNQ